MKKNGECIMKLVLTGIVILFNLNLTLAQHQDIYSKEFFISGNDTLKYRMLLPKEYDKSKQYPLVLFLHGLGERGDDNEKQLLHGSKLFVDNRDAFPAIIIFPQCPETDFWANAEVDRSTKPISLNFPLDIEPGTSMMLVMKLMEEMTSKSFVNKNQIYVGGLSMGGMGTFEILSRMPDMFSAAFAICGAGNPEATEAYAKKVPMWIFHGAKDDVVNPQASLDMVSGILKYGGTPNFSLFAKDNHNSWDSTFSEPKLLPWLFSNSKK